MQGASKEWNAFLRRKNFVVVSKKLLFLEVASNYSMFFDMRVVAPNLREERSYAHSSSFSRGLHFFGEKKRKFATSNCKTESATQVRQTCGKKRQFAPRFCNSIVRRPHKTPDLHMK